MSSSQASSAPAASADTQVFDAIQRRVLWLAVAMVHHANHVRPNPEKLKVGGHQASSASVVTLLTALFFRHLRAGDRIAVKPHASPALHAIHYLLGNLDAAYLTQLRAYGGLQAYPSRTKDPDPIDFSTGSVGLGAVAPAFAALAERYAISQFGRGTPRRFVALVGDAELDEGNVWEAVAEPALAGLHNALMIVDLNRQSLDRIVPGIRAAQLKRMFAEGGWAVIEAKYGAALQAVFALPGGEALRETIDAMPNEAYQAMIRHGGSEARQRLLAHAPDPQTLAWLLREVDDDELPALVGNLGGHDLAELDRAFAEAGAVTDRPVVLFAYTIKGWELPTAADQMNHSALLTPAQLATLAEKLGTSMDAPWEPFAPGTPEAICCAEAASRLRIAAPPAPAPAIVIPPSIVGDGPAQSSTQEAFGRTLARLTDLPDVARRVVTTAPDVSTSTNLTGWINKTGVWAPAAAARYEPEGEQRLVRWEPGPRGQHLELGISEMNLFMLLGQLGLSQEINGELLLPVGTVYDPFVLRGLDALVYGLYSGAKFVFAGTPSGITLAPEGGAHQSTVTPSLGISLPNLISYETCFARETEWALLEGLRQCLDRTSGKATYLRLSTRQVEQALLAPALASYGEDGLRRAALAGGYTLLEGDSVCERPLQQLTLAASGAVIPDVLAAARLLGREGVAATVLNLTSPGLLFHRWRVGDTGQLQTLLPPARRAAPIVTVHDASAHTLAWLGSVYGAPLAAIGVDSFGQSGSRADLYTHFGLTPDAIAERAFALIDDLPVNRAH